MQAVSSWPLRNVLDGIVRSTSAVSSRIGDDHVPASCSITRKTQLTSACSKGERCPRHKDPGRRTGRRASAAAAAASLRCCAARRCSAAATRRLYACSASRLQASWRASSSATIFSAASVLVIAWAWAACSSDSVCSVAFSPRARAASSCFASASLCASAASAPERSFWSSFSRARPDCSRYCPMAYVRSAPCSSAACWRPSEVALSRSAANMVWYAVASSASASKSWADCIISADCLLSIATLASSALASCERYLALIRSCSATASLRSCDAPCSALRDAKLSSSTWRRAWAALSRDCCSRSPKSAYALRDFVRTSSVRLSSSLSGLMASLAAVAFLRMEERSPWISGISSLSWVT
mmetsp:Transcript_43198/g.90473  ORF Transcript_43198/g.90473 Transcript_43198/m.90473 type:complete len:357 (+) Transcript_43198:1220-2290(+)